MNRMLFACYGAGFNGYPLLHDIVEATKEYQAGVELTVFTKNSRFPDHMFGLMREVISFKDTYITLHGPYYEVEAATEEHTPENDYFLDGYRQAFGVYHAFHAHSIVAHTNQYAFDPSMQAIMLSRSLATMKKLSAMAKEAEVNLLFENVGEHTHGNLLYDQKLFIDLFSRLPEHVGALIDIGHAILNDWDIFSVIDALGSRIRGYHIHNNDGTRDAHLPLFTEGLKYDQTQMKKLLRFMEKKAPNSEWILEYAPGAHITPFAIKRDMDKIVTYIS